MYLTGPSSNRRNGGEVEKGQRILDGVKGMVKEESWVDWSIPIFHGTDCELRPDDFDFGRARRNSDFGKAMYFSFSFNLARNWATSRKKKHPRVNCYLFQYGKALNEGVSIELIDDDKEWIQLILNLIDNPYHPSSDVIIGSIMDGPTGSIVQEYQMMADEKGMKIIDLEEDLKAEMIEKLNPVQYGLQVAFKNGKGLRYVQFIDSMEVEEMPVKRVVDPADIAADVSLMISEYSDISQNDAIIHFMRTETFRSLLSNPCLESVDPKVIFNDYLVEVSSHE